MQRQTQLKPETATNAFTPVQSAMLQRRCACGGAPGATGECEGCSKKRIQRKAGSSEMEARNEFTAPPLFHDVLRSPGQPLDNAVRTFMEPRFGQDFSQISVHGTTSPTERMRIHVNGAPEEDPIHRPIIEQFRLSEGLPPSGVDEFGQQVGPSDAEIKYGGRQSTPRAPTTGAPTTPARPGPSSVTPCPTTVSVGAVTQRNHSNLSASEKEVWGTWLGAMSRMDVGPGPHHSGHCMKERLTTVSNTCPASVYTRGGETIEPCTGNKCLDINRYGSMWGLSDGPTAFLDMHRTRAPHSLLEGSGVRSCSVVCEQNYSCDRTHPATGTFRITRNFQAGSHTKADGTTMHITTGTVTKT
jgi:hypothetical protein